MEFQKFKSIPRLSKDCIITEKIDGTNGQICIYPKDNLYSTLYLNEDCYISQNFINTYCLGETEDYLMFAGSRKRWITPENDNYGFAKWVKENAEELLKLGEGHHYGEWYGKGIQRGYDLPEKRFALFNIGKWHNHDDEARLISIDPKTQERKYTIPAPKCCETVPVIYKGLFDTNAIKNFIEELKSCGSYAVPGYMNPEGLVVYHTASGQLFKKTLENDNGKFNKIEENNE